ncbi:uncharacterized protein LOC134537192 [Bacillus rossius redtenbacheri]|uniref:uncharacterized protein LOC134537192 n=1 Tax=Bacillus rossius redtenbacheri TaxID=93214 RepID=UPI002FDE2F6A
MDSAQRPASLPKERLDGVPPWLRALAWQRRSSGCRSTMGTSWPVLGSAQEASRARRCSSCAASSRTVWICMVSRSQRRSQWPSHTRSQSQAHGLPRSTSPPAKRHADRSALDPRHVFGRETLSCWNVNMHLVQRSHCPFNTV